MNSTTKLSSAVRRFSMVASLAFFATCAHSISHAQLLVERYRGGLHRYSATGNYQSASFDLAEASRITAITGWLPGGNRPVSVSISLPFSNDDPDDLPFPQTLFEASFQLTPVDNPPPGERIDSGKWQGVGSLKWDLEAGTYNVNFDGSPMPFAYPYQRPHPDVPVPYDFLNFQDTELIGRYPFGLRIYGAPLSAVPESSAYAAIASIMALAAVLGRRRWLRAGT